MNEIVINVDKLRRDLSDDSLGAFFGGGFGGALIEAIDIERASDEQIVEIARKRGIDFRKYQV